MMAANLLKDINSVITSVGGSNPQQMTVLASTAFFVAQTPDHGAELWKSDGSPSGTQLVKDIYLGTNSSNISSLTIVGSTLYFAANDGTNGAELWKSDGTTAGTMQVKDIFAGTGNPAPSSLVNLNGTLYFSAIDTVAGIELWKSDGTAAGTVQVKDILAGANSSAPNNLTNVNGTLFFSASDTAGGNELWKSDGTAAGTVQVKDISAGTSSSGPNNLTNVNGTLYFGASDAAGGNELWKSDGSVTGTVQVKDIFAGTSSSGPNNLTNMNGTLFFGASDAAGGNELWKSDGTVAGTVQVKDISVGTSSSSPSALTNLNGTLFFGASDAAGGSELWKTDGTAAGTVQLKDINSGVGSSAPSVLTNFGGILYFRAFDPTNGTELWKSDGSVAGTVIVADIAPGLNSSVPSSLISVNNKLFFAASNGTSAGNELWISDGSVSGTSLVKDIYKITGSSSPQHGTNVNGVFFFTANDGTSGEELWRSDGTEAGTVIVKDIRSGGSSSPRYLTNVNGTLYFSADDGVNGAELWKSDGTTEGTILIEDIRIGATTSDLRYLTNVNGTLYFRANDGVNGAELWSSDGTAEGTALVVDLGAGNSNPFLLTNFEGTLYFNSNNRLVKSDGTAAGTVIIPGVSPNKFTASGGILYFSAFSSSTGTELWKSDGTEQGTQLVRDIVLGFGSGVSSSTPFVDVAGVLYFAAATTTFGEELWRSDGTMEGTRQVSDIFPGNASSTPTYLTNVNGTLYFTAGSSGSGQELWKSDGTPEGTVQVREININIGSYPRYLTNVAGALYFAANDGSRGTELWKTDGTFGGTTLVTDVAPGTPSGNPIPMQTVLRPKSFVEVNQKLYFRGTTLAEGSELFVVDASGPVVLSGNPIFDYAGSSGLVIRRNGTRIEISETSGLVVASGELASINRLTINNAGSVSLSLANGGFFSLPGGLQVNATQGLNNSLTVSGTGFSHAVHSAAVGAGGSDQLAVTENGLSNTIRYNGFEDITIDGMFTFGGTNTLFVQSGTLTIGSTLPANLPSLTSLSGGTINASSIALGSGEGIVGWGDLNGRLSAELGSSIQLTGNLTVGNAVSAAGVNTRGDVLVNSHTLTLLDSNQAVLGSLTSLGTSTATGTVIAANGALIDFGNNLVGYGTLQTPNVASKPTMINGSVEGTSITNPVTLSGFIKGVGTLNNVSITGTYSPGFSPAAVELGSVSYASSSVTVVELGGTTPGLQHDQLNHVGQALLGGTLDIELINGYQPTLGASFTILTATGGVSGVFSSVELPPLASGLEWQISYGTQSVIATVQQINFAPTDLALSSSTIAENRPASTPVGSFTTVDANSSETFTYSLVTGNGSADNSAFTVVGSQLVANSSFNYESKISYAIRVRTTDLGGLSFEKELTITVENALERTAPVQIGDGTVQRSVVNRLVVSFDQAIAFDTGAFQVFQRVKDSNNSLVLVPVTTNVTLAATAGGMTATLTFSGALTRAGTNALVDGNYQLTINGGLIRILNTTKTFDADGDGNGGGLYTLGNQSTDNFFALLGDANGNGEVDAQDLLGAKLALRKTIGQAGYNSAYDINGNGVVDAQDILNIQLNLRKKRVFF